MDVGKEKGHVKQLQGRDHPHEFGRRGCCHFKITGSQGFYGLIVLVERSIGKYIHPYLSMEFLVDAPGKFRCSPALGSVFGHHMGKTDDNGGI